MQALGQATGGAGLVDQPLQRRGLLPAERAQCLCAQQHHGEENDDGSITIQFGGCDGQVPNPGECVEAGRPGNHAPVRALPAPGLCQPRDIRLGVRPLRGNHNLSSARPAPGRFAFSERRCGHEGQRASAFPRRWRRDGRAHSRVRLVDDAARAARDLVSGAAHARVGVLLANRFPLLLWWGPDYISIYNDAYVPILGRKAPEGAGSTRQGMLVGNLGHPQAPDRYAVQWWAVSTWIEDFELHIQRLGFPRRGTSPSPTARYQTTRRRTASAACWRRCMKSPRRSSANAAWILRDLGVQAAESSAEETCRVAAQTLARHGKDVPFALLYLDRCRRPARAARRRGRN